MAFEFNAKNVTRMALDGIGTVFFGSILTGFMTAGFLTKEIPVFNLTWGAVIAFAIAAGFTEWLLMKTPLAKR